MFNEDSSIVTRSSKVSPQLATKAKLEALMKRQLCADVRHLLSGGAA